MTYAPQAHVDRSRKFGVHLAKRAPEGVWALGYADQVNMILHEEVAQDGYAKTTRVIHQQLEVEPVIFGRK